MRKGRWISLGLTVGVGLMLGLNSGWVSAQDQTEGSGEVQERGVIGEFPQKPPLFVDLVPVQVKPPGNCVRNASGQLLVPIANLGTGQAPATILSTQYGNNIIRPTNVPPINPLSLTIVAVDAPGCPPTCGFLIRVDASGVVAETGWPDPLQAERNNEINVICTP
jgi:hypothetical protein